MTRATVSADGETITVHILITAHAGADSGVVVLTPTTRELSMSVLRQVPHIQMMSVIEMLKRKGDPFALRLPVTATPPPPAAVPIPARLVIDGGGHTATVDGRELDLEPRDFRVLHMLAVEASAGGGWVFRALIGDALRETTRHDSGEEQIEKSISRIRSALGAATSGRSGLKIETKRMVGYRLVIPSKDINLL